MSARHELCAAAMRQYGTDPDGVERAMRAAGHSATVAHASRDVYADFLRKNGYDVDGPGGEDAPDWALAMVRPAVDVTVSEPTVPPDPIPDEPEPVAPVVTPKVKQAKRGGQ